MTEKPLIHKPGKRTLVHRARAFLEFKHKHEEAWELFEFTLITAVFVLLILQRGELSHALGIIAHVVAGLLLLTKFVCVAAWRVSVRYEDTYGVTL
jgi:hypothetical protein